MIPGLFELTSACAHTTVEANREWRPIVTEASAAKDELLLAAAREDKAFHEALPT